MSIAAGAVKGTSAPAEGSLLQGFRTWALTNGGWAPATVKVQVRQLLFLAEHYRLPLDERFCFEAGLDVLAERRARGASVWAYNTDVKALNKLMAWPALGGDERRYAKLPAPEGEFRALGEGQVRALLDYEHPEATVNRFRRAYVTFNLYAGLRGSEYAAMQRDEIHFAAHPRYGSPWFEVAHPAKRGRARELPLSGWMAQATRPFRAYVDWRDSLGLKGDLARALWVVTPGRTGPFVAGWRRPGQDYLRKLLNELGHEVLGESFSATVARHTVLLDMVERGVPFTHVQFWAGHRSPGSTAIYTKVRAEHVFEAVRRRPRRDPYRGLVMPE